MTGRLGGLGGGRPAVRPGPARERPWRPLAARRRSPPPPRTHPPPPGPLGGTHGPGRGPGLAAPGAGLGGAERLAGPGPRVTSAGNRGAGPGTARGWGKPGPGEAHVPRPAFPAASPASPAPPPGPGGGRRELRGSEWGRGAGEGRPCHLLCCRRSPAGGGGEGR